PMHWAASRGHTRLARYLVQSGHKINAYDALYQTPLLHAVKAGNVGTVSYLIGAGTNPIEEDHLLGGTPLHWAALGGNLEEHLIRVLVEGGWGAQRVLRHSAGATPLHWAARGGHVAAVRLLVKAGARVGDQDGEG
ncbi:ankyrin repeat protein, partial [Choiromyces venosus 120613-1]